MTRSRRSSRYLGTFTQTDLDAAAERTRLELTEDERAELGHDTTIGRDER